MIEVHPTERTIRILYSTEPTVYVINIIGRISASESVKATLLKLNLIVNKGPPNFKSEL